MGQKKRLARTVNRAAGIPYTTARRLTDARQSTWRQPIPDARTWTQRSFEARLVYALIEGFPEDDSLGGNPWGIQAVYPLADRIDIYPAGGMAETVIAALLPWDDRDFGGVRGAEGVRGGRHDSGWLNLRDVDSDATARIRIDNPENMPKPALAAASRQGPHGSELTSFEREERAWLQDMARYEPPGWMAYRDLIGSRFLRRPGLTRWAASRHGSANIYTHSKRDIVVEWCCGPSLHELVALVDRSGLTAVPDRASVGWRLPEDDGRWMEASIGSATFLLREIPCWR